MNFLRRILDQITYPFRVIFSSPMALFSQPRMILGMTLPCRLAVFSLLLLLLCTVMALVIFSLNEQGADWNVWGRGVWYAVPLLIVIPLAVYKVTKLWLEGDPSRFPEIDQAWYDGLKALKEHHIDLTDVPLFLVTGVEDDRHARNIMAASETSFAVNGFPEGPAPLHWFANDSAIFLVLTQVTCVGKLLAKFETAGGLSAGIPEAPKGKGMFTETMVPEAGGGGFTQTADSFGDESFGDTPPVAPAPAAPQFTGTVGVIDTGAGILAQQLGPANRRQTGYAKLDDAEIRNTEARLEYVLELLRLGREPFSPVNGILSMIPFKLLKHSAQQADEVRTTAARDVDLLLECLQVRCALSVVVDGMESESGFRELARRIGRDTVKRNRFGKGNPEVWTPATEDNVEAIVRHSCGAFEDWAYHLFSTPGGLSKLGNTKLYSLLCLVRNEVQERLIRVLCHAYGRDSDEADKDPHFMLMSGVYFAATGDRDDKQAFVKSVFDKLVEQEEKLSWTDDAIIVADRYRFLGNVASMISLVMFLMLVLLTVMYFDENTQKKIMGLFN